MTFALSGPALAQSQPTGPFVVKPVDAKAPVQFYSASYALVIGIDNYSDGWSRLNMAVADAVAIADELERHGFIVRLIVDKPVKTASGRTVDAKRIDRDALVKAIEDFVYTHGSEADARLLLWFAGHGHTIDNIGYLVPTGATNPLIEPHGLRAAAEARFRRNALSMQRFSEYMREIKARHVLTIFDSCFSGSGFGTRGNEPTLPDGYAITLAAKEPVRHRIASGDALQVVADDGKFRSYVIDALRGRPDGRGVRADQNGDGFVTATELGRHISSLTAYYTPHQKQVPQSAKILDDRFDRGEFVFRVVPETGAATADAIAKAAWKHLGDHPSANALRAFSKKFPTSTLAETAAAAAAIADELERLKADAERQRRILTYLEASEESAEALRESLRREKLSSDKIKSSEIIVNFAQKTLRTRSNPTGKSILSQDFGTRDPAVTIDAKRFREARDKTLMKHTTLKLHIEDHQNRLRRAMTFPF